MTFFNQDFLDEISELEKELTETQALKNSRNLLKNNVIGDLGKFGVTLLKSGLSTMNCKKFYSLYERLIIS